MKKMPFSFFGLILFAAAASMNCYADDVKSVALNEYNYKGIVLQEYGTLQINKSTRSFVCFDKLSMFYCLSSWSGTTCFGWYGRLLCFVGARCSIACISSSSCW